MKSFVLFVVLFFSQLTFANLTPGQNTQIENLVLKFHTDKKFHGSIAIVNKAGNVVYKKTVGIAHQEFDVPHTEKSKFMIASLSKQFTAYAILNLQSLGKLKISDLVSKYIDLPVDNNFNSETLKMWNSITLRQLLTHTSGLKRDVQNSKNFDVSALHTLAKVVASQLTSNENPHGKLFLGNPGDKFYYSNFGYVLLAAVIERTDFAMYNQYIQNKIFIPLKMYESGQYHRRNYIKNMSSGYFESEDFRTKKRCCRDASIFTGSHSLYSTIGDMVKWTKEIFYHSEKMDNSIINELLKNQLSPEQVASNEGKGYGYGFEQDRYKGVERVWHSGHEFGFVSLLSHLPTSGYSIVLLSNRHGFVGSTLFNIEIHDRLTDLLAGH